MCGACNVSCVCGGYGLPWVDGHCTPVCGDGLVLMGEQCDDNNTDDGDGCSNACSV